MKKEILEKIKAYYAKKNFIKSIECKINFTSGEETEGDCLFMLNVVTKKHVIKNVDIYFVLNEMTQTVHAQIHYIDVKAKIIKKTILEELSLCGDNCFLSKDNFIILNNDVLNFDKLNDVIYTVLMCENIESVTSGGENINGFKDFSIWLQNAFDFIDNIEELDSNCAVGNKKFLNCFSKITNNQVFNMLIYSNVHDYIRIIKLNKNNYQEILNFLSTCENLENYPIHDKSLTDDLFKYQRNKPHGLKLEEYRNKINDDLSKNKISFDDYEDLNMTITKDMFMEAGLYIINKFVSVSCYSFEIYLKNKWYIYSFKIKNEEELNRMSSIIF